MHPIVNTKLWVLITNIRLSQVFILESATSALGPLRAIVAINTPEPYQYSQLGILSHPILLGSKIKLPCASMMVTHN